MNDLHDWLSGQHHGLRTYKTFQQKLDALIADGTYKTLLAKWKLNDNGIEKATINAGQ